MSIKAQVKVTKPIMICPEQQVVIHGYCRVGSSARGNLLVDSSVDCSLPGCLVLQPSMLRNDMSSCVPLCISNIGSKPVTIPSQTTIAELQSVHVASATIPDKCSGSLNLVNPHLMLINYLGQRHFLIDGRMCSRLVRKILVILIWRNIVFDLMMTRLLKIDIVGFHLACMNMLDFIFRICLTGELLNNISVLGHQI